LVASFGQVAYLLIHGLKVGNIISHIKYLLIPVLYFLRKRLKINNFINGTKKNILGSKILEPAFNDSERAPVMMAF